MSKTIGLASWTMTGITILRRSAAGPPIRCSILGIGSRSKPTLLLSSSLMWNLRPHPGQCLKNSIRNSSDRIGRSDKYQLRSSSACKRMTLQSASQLTKASRVLETPAADPKTSENHFSSRLAFETDPSDVYADVLNGVPSIVIIDARTPDAYARGHVPGAISLPYRAIDTSTTALLPLHKVLVIYCDGVYCNASTKAAARLTALGFRVKEMLDGMSGWRAEGYPVEETVLQLSAQNSR